MAEVTIKLDSPIITTDKSISEITTDGLANTGEIALATDGIVGNVNGALRKYPNPIKTFYVEKFVTNGAAKWGFEPKDVKTNDVVMIKTATENLMFTVAEATNTKATLCAFTKNGGTRIVEGRKLGDAFIGFSLERVADYYSGKTYEYSLSEDLTLTGVTPFTEIDNAIQCVPSYYIAVKNGKNYLKLKYGNDRLLPIGASYDGFYGCVFYFIINHKGQQKLVVFQVTKRSSDDQIITSLSFVDLGFSPFNLTIGKTTKQINGTADVSFSAEEITDKFIGALIQNLTTASTEADIRKAFTEVNAKTVLFPTPGSIISKLDGNNKGIVVSLSEPDATTLGRSIVVYYGDGTYTIVVKNDFTKVLVPWRKDSSLRDLYISAGAVYNERTGYYELNGLTDITEEEMRVIYEKTWGWWLHLPTLNGFGTALPRTNIPCPDYKIIAYASNISLNSIFSVSRNDDNLEVVNLRALYTPNSFNEIKIVDFNWAFQGDKKIREVQGIINIKEARNNQNIGGNIETINIKGLKVSIRFYSSQRLSKESVLYMINNSEATSAITIGLNKAVYDVMKDDADIIAALAEKTNITLIQNT